MGKGKVKNPLKTFPKLGKYLASNRKVLEQIQQESSPLYWMNQGVRFDPEDQKGTVIRSGSQDTTFPLDDYVDRFISQNKTNLQGAYQVLAESDEAGQQQVNKQFQAGLVNLLVGYLRKKAEDAAELGSSNKRYFQMLKIDLEGTVEKIGKIDLGEHSE